MKLEQGLIEPTLDDVYNIHRATRELAKKPAVEGLAVINPLYPLDQLTTADGLQLGINNVARWDTSIDGAPVAIWATTHRTQPITGIDDSTAGLSVNWIETGEESTKTEHRSVAFLLGSGKVYFDRRFLNSNLEPKQQTEQLLAYTHTPNVLTFFAEATKAVCNAEAGATITSLKFSQGPNSVYASSSQTQGYPVNYSVRTNIDRNGFSAEFQVVNGAEVLTNFGHSWGTEFTRQRLLTISSGVGVLLSKFGELVTHEIAT